MDIRIISSDELLASVEHFITHHDFPPSTLGRLTIGDANLVSDLKKGRSLSLDRAKMVCDFMSEYSRKCPPKPPAIKGYAKGRKAKGVTA